MNKLLTISLALSAIIQSVTSFGSFAVPNCNVHNAATATTVTTALSMASEDEDMLRFARSSRSAAADDNIVELRKPLGLVLNQDDNGNVYVETVAAKGNAARSGKVCVCTSLSRRIIVPWNRWNIFLSISIVFKRRKKLCESEIIAH